MTARHAALIAQSTRHAGPSCPTFRNTSLPNRQSIPLSAVQEEDYEYARTLITDLQSSLTQENFYWIQKAMSLQSKLPAEETTLSLDQS